MRILIISADQYEDLELEIPFLELRDAGFDVEVASVQSGVITGKHGSQTRVDLSVDDVAPESYAMLILPGGKAPALLRKSTSVINIVKHFFKHNKPVAAICHGPQILISAGLVKGRRMTSYKEVAPELISAGADYLDAGVVVDGNLITSRKPGDLTQFMREVRKKLVQKAA